MNEKQELDDEGYPIAWARLIPPGPGHGDWYLWKVPVCPLCGRGHTHGAGKDGTLDGHRVSHCGEQRVKDDRGYVIRKIEAT